MSVVVGIDVGAYKHAAAICRAGERVAEKRVLRYEATRRGFQELDAWRERQGEVERVVVESSGHYWWPLASHLHRRGVPVAVVNPLEAKYFAKSRCSAPSQTRPMRAHWRRWGCASNRRPESRCWVPRCARQRASVCAWCATRPTSASVCCA